MQEGKKRVRKAVLPAAGRGTRMLPATKAVPKEMLPILDKPIIQYAVEECHASGLEEVIVVVSERKGDIEAHFQPAPELESFLERTDRSAVAEQIRRISRLARISYTQQKERLGLGHSVLCAKQLVGEEPFAVLLSDVFIDGPRPATRRLMEVHERTGLSIVAVQRVPQERVGQCGIVAVEAGSVDGRVHRVLDVVEKPDPNDAPSDLGIVGRYVLAPGIFDCLERTPPGRGGEIQLSDALAMLARSGKLLALVCDDNSFDAGDKRGFLALTLQLALRDPELGSWLRRYLRTLAENNEI